MTQDRRDPSSTPPGAALTREARLAEALRANLHRRKAQARARAEGGADAGHEDPAADHGENHEGED